MPAGRWRLGPEVILVRGCAGAAGLVALLLAMPGAVVAHRVGMAALLALAVLAAAAPRGPWTTVVVLVAAGGWVVATTGYGLPVTTWRVVLLASALYLLHSLSTLATALPHDAVVAPDVVLRWGLRALLVVTAAALLSAVVLAGAAALAVRVHQVATVVGLVVAACLAILLTLAASRSSGRPGPSA